MYQIKALQPNTQVGVSRHQKNQQNFKHHSQLGQDQSMKQNQIENYQKMNYGREFHINRIPYQINQGDDQQIMNNQDYIYEDRQEEEEEDEEEQIENDKEKLLQLNGSSQLHAHQQNDNNNFNLFLPTQNKVSETFSTGTIKERVQNSLMDLKVGLVSSGLKKLEWTLQRALLECQNEEFKEIFQKIIKGANKIAVELLGWNDSNSAIKLLTRCEQWTNASDFGIYPELRIISLNNLGCACQKEGNIQQAIQYCEEALKILQVSQLRKHLAMTYMNLSALNSILGKQKKALELARTTLLESQHEFMQIITKEEIKQQKDDAKDDNSVDEEGTLFEKENQTNLLIISYFNMGASEELNGNYDNALRYFENAVSASDEYLGEKDLLCIHMHQEYNKFSQRYAYFQVHELASPQGQPVQLMTSTDSKFPKQIQQVQLIQSEILKTKTKKKFKKFSKKKTKLNVFSPYSQPTFPSQIINPTSQSKKVGKPSVIQLPLQPNPSLSSLHTFVNNNQMNRPVSPLQNNVSMISSSLKYQLLNDKPQSQISNSHSRSSSNNQQLILGNAFSVSRPVSATNYSNQQSANSQKLEIQQNGSHPNSEILQGIPENPIPFSTQRIQPSNRLKTRPSTGQKDSKSCNQNSIVKITNTPLISSYLGNQSLSQSQQTAGWNQIKSGSTSIHDNNNSTSTIIRKLPSSSNSKSFTKLKSTLNSTDNSLSRVSLLESLKRQFTRAAFNMQSLEKQIKQELTRTTAGSVKPLQSDTLHSKSQNLSYRQERKNSTTGNIQNNNPNNQSLKGRYEVEDSGQLAEYFGGAPLPKKSIKVQQQQPDIQGNNFHSKTTSVNNFFSQNNSRNTSKPFLIRNSKIQSIATQNNSETSNNLSQTLPIQQNNQHLSYQQAGFSNNVSYMLQKEQIQDQNMKQEIFQNSQFNPSSQKSSSMMKTNSDFNFVSFSPEFNNQSDAQQQYYENNDIIQEYQMIQIKELTSKDSLSAPIHSGSLIFVLNPEKMCIKVEFLSKSCGQLHHFVNISDLLQQKSNKNLRGLLVNFCSEIKNKLFVNKMQNCLSIVLDHTNGNMTVKLELKKLDTQLDIVVKNSSESILLLEDDAKTLKQDMYKNQDDEDLINEYEQEQDLKGEIRPLINKMSTESNKESVNDDISPLMYDPNQLKNSNKPNYSQKKNLYIGDQIAEIEEADKVQQKKKHQYGIEQEDNYEEKFEEDEDILEDFECDDDKFEQDLERVVKTAKSNFIEISESTKYKYEKHDSKKEVKTQQQNKPQSSKIGEINKQSSIHPFQTRPKSAFNKAVLNQEEEGLEDEVEYSGSKFGFQSNNMQKQKKEDSSINKQPLKENQSNAKKQLNLPLNSVQLSNTNNGKQKKQLIEIESQLDIPQEDERFCSSKQSAHFAFDEDMDGCNSNVRNQYTEEEDASQNQSFRQLVDHAIQEKNVNRESSHHGDKFPSNLYRGQKSNSGEHLKEIHKSESVILKKDSENKSRSDIQSSKNNQIKQANDSTQFDLKSNNTKAKQQISDSLSNSIKDLSQQNHPQEDNSVVQNPLSYSSSQSFQPSRKSIKRNTPPPKIVINNGFDNEDPFVAYDSQQEVKNKEEQAKEEFQKLLEERDPQQLNFAATFIQKKYKNKKLIQKQSNYELVEERGEIQKDHEDKNRKIHFHIQDALKEQKDIKYQQKNEQDAPIDINDQNRQEFEKAASLIGMRYKERKQNLAIKKEESSSQQRQQNLKTSQKDLIQENNFQINKQKQINQQQKNDFQVQNQEPVLEGPLEEYERAANLIGMRYRQRKQNLASHKEDLLTNEQEQQRRGEKNNLQINGQEQQKRGEKSNSQMNEEQKTKEQLGSKNQKESEEIVLDGPVEEYEKAANMIGAAFKKRKQNLQKQKNEEQPKKVQANPSQSQSQQIISTSQHQQIQKKQKEEIILLDGPVEEYAAVANKIGAAYKLKKERQRKEAERTQIKKQQLDQQESFDPVVIDVGKKRDQTDTQVKIEEVDNQLSLSQDLSDNGKNKHQIHANFSLNRRFKQEVGFII